MCSVIYFSKIGDLWMMWLIVGGGIIGVATAYFLSKEGRKVRVIERDPTYKKASFPLSFRWF